MHELMRSVQRGTAEPIVDVRGAVTHASEHAFVHSPQSVSLLLHIIRKLQARIQEFSSEGVQISENFDKPKRRGGGRKKTEGCGDSFASAEVWFKLTFQTNIYIQVYFR